MLLFQKNENVYKEKLALYDLIIDIDDSETTMQLYNQEVTALNLLHNRQKTMITWEGLTFLILLILGIVRLNRYLKKEIAVARQQSNFLLSITHELKSPLASALLNIQTLKKRPELGTEKKTRLLNNSESELSRLEELVGKLLFAARLEDGPIYHAKDRVDLSKLYHQLYTGFKDRYESEFTLKHGIENELWVQGDALLLSSIFTNLTDNASKYCPSGGEISIDLRREEDMAHFSVFNDGQAIDPKEKQRIWQKFYRIGDEHTRSSTGTGLGLYIVKRIVESHKGRISVKDKSGGGVIFDVDIPLANSDQEEMN